MKQKLFLFTADFPYGVGEKTFILPELSYLVNSFDVTIVSTGSQDEIDDEDNISKLDKRIKVYAIPRPTGWKKKLQAISATLFSVMGSDLFWKEVFQAQKEGRFSFSCIKEIASFYVRAILFSKEFRRLFSPEDTKNAVFYTFWCDPMTLSLVMQREKFKPRMIVTRMHGRDLYHERTACGRQPFRNYLNDKLDGIFFVAREAMRYYEMIFPECRKEILYFCPLGVFSCGLSPVNEAVPFELVSCSYVVSLKRIDLIIRALADMPDNMMINWTHFGFGDKFDEIKWLAKKLLSNKKNISYEFKGMTPNDRILAFYTKTAISCFITTSATEGGTPVAVQEALSCGIPVIGTDVGGIKAAIRGNGVLLSPNPSIREIVSAIEKMYTLSKTEKVEYQKRSFELWQNKFDTEKNTRYLCEVINNIGM